MKSCNSCGGIVRPDAIFCPICGSRDLSDIPEVKKPLKIEALLKAMLCAVYLFAVQFAVSLLYTVVVTVLAIVRMGLEGNELEYYVSAHMSHHSTVVGIASNVIAFVLLVLYFSLKGKKVSAEVGMRRFPPVLIPLCGILGYALQYVIVFITYLVPWPYNWLENHSESTTELVSGNIILAIIGVAVVTGLIEEIVFRALSIGCLDRAFGTKASIIISAVVFGAAHLHPVQIFYATLLGLLLGGIYKRFNSVWPCVITHLSFNLAGVLGLPSSSPVLYQAVLAVSFGITVIFTYLIFIIIPAYKENKSI